MEQPISAPVGSSSSESETDNENDKSTSHKSNVYGKAVEQIDPKTGVVVRRYGNGTVAARMMQCDRTKISSACRGIKRLYANFIWRFYYVKEKKPGINENKFV